MMGTKEYGRKELSTYRKVRLSHILDELRDIFNAEMVELVSPEPTISDKTDYTIRIYNGDIIDGLIH